MPTVLTIAGSDSSGGGGVQADLKTFAAYGVHGASAITAVTAQSTDAIASIEPLPADLVTAQIEAVAGDLTLLATKVGMLAVAAIVEAVAAAIEELELPLVVVDPVLASTSGTRLLDDDGVRALCAELLPRAFVVTPNVPEARTLSGVDIRAVADMKDAARRIHELGATCVIVKGGHLDGRATDVVDVLFDGHVFTEFRADRVQGVNVHGSGCAFSSAVAAGLARGWPVRDAAERAQAYVAGAMRHARAIGRGPAIIDHFWQWRRPPRP